MHGLLQKRVEMPSESSRHVHGAKGVHEARMFRRGIDPSGALQLINISQPLDPGRIDQIFFGAFVRIEGARKGR